jgi:hypothetical protein
MIYFLTDEPFNIYPLSRIHNALQDAETEIYISTYKNKILKGGFFGKKIFIIPKLVDDGMDKTSPYYIERFKQQEELKENLKKFMGVENIDNVMLLTLGVNDVEELEKSLVVKNIQADINPDLFNGIEMSVADNVRVMFNNIPDVLVRSSNGVFEQSGEAFRQAKIFYNEQVAGERDVLNGVLRKTMRHSDFNDLAITPFNFENQ